jgi:microcin C transport system permease protein
VTSAAHSLSPNQRAWARFRRNRVGHASFWVLVAMLALSLVAELISNDRPVVAVYQGQWTFPVLDNPPERV